MIMTNKKLQAEVELAQRYHMRQRLTNNIIIEMENDSEDEDDDD